MKKNPHTFTSNQLVSYEDLGKAYKPHHSKIRCHKKPEPQDNNPEEDTGEAFVALEIFAIDLLKDLGYKIFAPVGTAYHEVQ